MDKELRLCGVHMPIRVAAGFLHNKKKIIKYPVNYQLAYTSNMQREINVGLKWIESFYWTTKITRKGCLSDTSKHDELMNYQSSRHLYAAYLSN